MIPITDLIKKLDEVREFYPDIPINVDKLIIHVDISKNETIYMELVKEI